MPNQPTPEPVLNPCRECGKKPSFITTKITKYKYQCCGLETDWFDFSSDNDVAAEAWNALNPPPAQPDLTQKANAAAHWQQSPASPSQPPQSQIDIIVERAQNSGYGWIAKEELHKLVRFIRSELIVDCVFTPLEDSQPPQPAQDEVEKLAKWCYALINGISPRVVVRVDPEWMVLASSILSRDQQQQAANLATIASQAADIKRKDAALENIKAVTTPGHYVNLQALGALAPSERQENK